MRRLWLTLLILAALPLWAMADQWYVPELSLSWRTLTDAQKAVYEVLYEGISAGETEITFASSANYDDVNLVMEIMVRDCPELCGLHLAWSIHYYRDQPMEATGVTVSYTAPLSRRQELRDAVIGILDGMSSDFLNRELEIHDYICNMTSYDTGGTSPFDAWGALIEGRAVCEGYAEAMVLMLRMSGIPASVLTGTQWNGSTWGLHAWVLLELNGIFTQVDVTSDDGTDMIWYDDYNLPDSDFDIDHIRDEASLRLPACTDASLGWHALTGNIAPTGSALRDFLHTKRDELSRNGVVRLRFSDMDDLNTALDFFSYSFSFTYGIRESRICLTVILTGGS